MVKQDTQMQVEEIYDRFEAAWAGDAIPDLEDYLPVGWSSAEGQGVFLELVLIDLDKRWQRPLLVLDDTMSSPNEATVVSAQTEFPRRPLLEDYCRRYPKLGTVGSLPLNAIANEVRVRGRYGDNLTFDEYSQRFPNRMAELRVLFANDASSLNVNTADTYQVSQAEVTLLEQPVAKKSPSAPTSLDDGIKISALRYPAPELSIGQVFGRYRIDGVLGRGGMGAVYRAYDSHLRRSVALKVPFFKRGYSEEVVQRFLREARAVARLSHANLCRVFDVGVIDGTLFLTMEFVEGQSLEQLFPPGEMMPEADVVSTVRQVALALQEAHDCGIIHRDLKPANIMRNAKGQPILMDFGLAREIDNEENDLTKDGAMLGTPAYMSPEQIRGHSRDIGPATDVYGLGVVMYRLLTGRRPFEGTLTAIAAAIPTETPVAPRELCKTIHPAIEAICLKAMAKNPVDRFASAAEMAAALDREIQVVLGRGQAPQNSELAEGDIVGHGSSRPPILNSAVPDPSFKRADFNEETTQSVSKPVASDHAAAASQVGVKTNRGLIGVSVTVVTVLLIAAWLKRNPNQDTKSSASTQPLTAVASLVKSDVVKSDDSPSSSGATKQIAAVTGSKIGDNAKPNNQSVETNPVLETHLQRAEQQAGFEILSQKSLPLHAKDKLQFHVTLNGPSYVYLYLIDTTGTPSRLWPETSEGLHQQQPVKEVWAPPLADEGRKQRMYFLDALKGHETVLVATSLKPLTQADLQVVDSLRVKPSVVKGNKPQLMAFGREDRDRGFGGTVETDKVLPVEIEDFTERLSHIFDSYTGIVFPHE